MANFPVLPFRYLPGPLTINQGPADRIQRSVLVVNDPPLQHEDYAIITVSADIPDINKEAMLDEVCAILARDHGAPVSDPRVYPLGVGLVRFASPVIRDHLISTSPHALDSDEEGSFSVIRHDEGLNRRAPVFQHEAWVMFLMFPLDFQTNYYVNKAVSQFGKLLLWHNPRVNKVRVLAKVLIKDLRLVPFSLLMAQAGNFFGAEGGSWSIPVYILDGRAVAPNAVGSEEPVPPMNVTPHPYELPFLNDLQQHHLNVQIWNQQHADVAWEQEAVQPEQLNQNGWGQWPVVAPPPSPDNYRGISFRAMTGYAGPSMLDGVVPPHNVTDNPSAWSPESDTLTDIEAAADSVITGIPSGRLSFSRATGDIVAMEVDTTVVQAFPADAVGRNLVRSVLLIEIADMHFSPARFSAMIRFLDNNIYSHFPALRNDLDSGFAGMEDCLVLDSGILCLLFSKIVFLTKVLQSQFGGFPEDLALKFDLCSLLSPSKRIWAPALDGLMIDDQGMWYWAEGFGPDALSGTSSSVSASSALSQTDDMEALSAPKITRRGRPRKKETPQVESEVKRSLRSNSQGYNYEMLSYQPSRCKVSKVVAASPPEVLQIEEMQRIGVEECDIDPAALTVERLLQQRKEQE
jgi:hypothetical protein